MNKFLSIISYLLLLSSCQPTLTSTGTILVINPHISGALFYYYIIGNTVRVEAKIQEEYYAGYISAVKPNHKKISLRKNYKSILRMSSTKNHLVECYIENNAKHIKKGGKGSCYSNNQRIYDITLGIARFDLMDVKSRSFLRFLAI